jgi:transcriptional regulator with XRE-family HTH domain
MTGSRADWIAIWRARLVELGWSYPDLAHRAGLTDKYFSRLMCGDIDQPTAETIDKINRAMGIRFYVKMTPWTELEVIRGRAIL